MGQHMKNVTPTTNQNTFMEKRESVNAVMRNRAANKTKVEIVARGERQWKQL